MPPTAWVTAQTPGKFGEWGQRCGYCTYVCACVYVGGGGGCLSHGVYVWIGVSVVSDLTAKQAP